MSGGVDSGHGPSCAAGLELPDSQLPRFASAGAPCPQLIVIVFWNAPGRQQATSLGDSPAAPVPRHCRCSAAQPLLPCPAWWCRERYYDDVYEYRHVVLPQDIAKRLPKDKLLSEAEWRQLGVQQSRGWGKCYFYSPFTLMGEQYLRVQQRLNGAPLG